MLLIVGLIVNSSVECDYSRETTTTIPRIYDKREKSARCGLDVTRNSIEVRDDVVLVHIDKRLYKERTVCTIIKWFERVRV